MRECKLLRRRNKQTNKQTNTKQPPEHAKESSQDMYTFALNIGSNTSRIACHIKHVRRLNSPIWVCKPVVNRRLGWRYGSEIVLQHRLQSICNLTIYGQKDIFCLLWLVLADILLWSYLNTSENVRQSAAPTPCWCCCVVSWRLARSGPNALLLSDWLK